MMAPWTKENCKSVVVVLRDFSRIFWNQWEEPSVANGVVRTCEGCFWMESTSTAFYR